MSKLNSKSPEVEKAKNYSTEQEAAIIAASPLNLESAKVLAEAMGKSYRSIIAKAKSLGLEYESKPAPKKRLAVVTKAELVSMIEAGAGAAEGSLAGLEKSPVKALNTLLALFVEAEDNDAETEAVS